MNKGLLAVIGLVALALGLPIGLSFVPALTVACPYGTTACGGGSGGVTPLPTPKPVTPLPVSSSPYISWIRLASAGVITIAALLVVGSGSVF